MIRIKFFIATRANNKLFTAEAFIPSSIIFANGTFHFYPSFSVYILSYILKDCKGSF